MVVHFFSPLSSFGLIHFFSEKMDNRVIDEATIFIFFNIYIFLHSHVKSYNYIYFYMYIYTVLHSIK
jgi:hypothetical protein